MIPSKPVALVALAALGLSGALPSRGDTPLDRLADRAAAGDHPAELELGRLYLEGAGVTTDVPRGRALLERAAAADLPVAHYLLARHLESAAPTVSSRERVLRHYRRAAELGHTTAQTRLGELLLARSTDPRFDAGDRARLADQARRLLVHAADAGNGYAELVLAEWTRDGRLGAPDPVRALDYFRRAEQHGQARAAWALARQALDRPQDDAGAEEGILHLARAADGGEAAATLELVRRYLDGDRLPRDLDKARAWLALAEHQDAAAATPLRQRIAALVVATVSEVGPTAQASPGALDVLSIAPTSREDSNEPPQATAVWEAPPRCPRIPSSEAPDRADQEQQVRHLEQRVAELAAERARLEARLQQADTRIAALLAERGDPTMERGFGLAAVRRRDYADALSHLRRAAAGDDAIALASLGTLRLRGKGGAADPVAAVDLLVRAAGLGDATAALNLAVIFRHGIGVPVDTDAAERWLALAAERGDIDARRQQARQARSAGTTVVAR